METLHKVQLFIESNQLLTPQSRVIVGVSGGVDSVVLLNILSKLGYECVVAHCNFHLRGKEPDRDEEFVAKLAEKQGLLYKKVDFDTVSYAKRHKISIEMAARDLRYVWFAGLLTDLRALAIAVAHQDHDSIETMPGIPAFSACVWLPGVLTCFISLGGHIRPQSGADTPPACCTARKCDIRPQRKFARSKVLKIAFIVVCSLPFKISTSAFPLTY